MALVVSVLKNASGLLQFQNKSSLVFCIVETTQFSVYSLIDVFLLYNMPFRWMGPAVSTLAEVRVHFDALRLAT